MQPTVLLRWCSQALSAGLGGYAVFCLLFAAVLSDPRIVGLCIVQALLFGGLATAIVYFQNKYLGS
jgi:hypothetical protein